jgi:Cu2+-exporting ATPase
LAASVALGRAAKRGVLIKGMQYLELLSKPGLIVFDKTGTLTQGKLSVSSFDGSPRVAALVRAAERQSAHPAARALLRDLPLGEALPVESFVERPGSGVVATVAGQRVLIGTQSHLESAGIEVDRDRLDAVLADGLSPICVGVDGRHVATFGVGDPVHPEADTILRHLVAEGYRLAILSGDHQGVVDRVASKLSVDLECALGGQTPEDKLRYVEEHRRKQVVYMVGDGVNDAAALAAASVGIAVHGGAEASLAAADVFTTKGGLSPIALLTHGARRTLAVIHRNLLFSLLYNLTAASLAMMGLISPLIAAVLMPLSSLTVLTNSLQSKTFQAGAPLEGDAR